MTRHQNAGMYAHTDLADTHMRAASPATGEAPDQEEITPPNKSNTQVPAEEVEIRVSSIHSSGSHKHWHTAYHQEHLSHMDQGQTHASNKYGKKLIKAAHKHELTAHWKMHTHGQQGRFLRGEEVRALCYQSSSRVVVEDCNSRAHILYLIYSRQPLHNVNIILHYPGTQRPSLPCVLHRSQSQGLHRDE